MNSAVGSPENTSPMERRSTLLTVTGRAVNGLAVAALLTGAALVELGALRTDRKAWVSVVGILLVGAGSVVA